MAERAQGTKSAQPNQAAKPQSEIGVDVEGATAVASQFLGQSEFAGGEAEDRRQDNPSFLTNLRRSDPRSRASTLTALQRSVGNAAVVRMIGSIPAPDAVIRRIPDGYAGPMNPPELKGVPPNLHTMSSSERISAIESLFSSGQANSGNLDIMWSAFGNGELEAARSNPGLFTKSLEQSSAIASHPPLKMLKDKFKSDVEGQALNYLSSNRDYVADEMKKIGAHGLEGSDQNPDQNPTAEQQHELREAQKVAERLAETKKAINGFKSIPLGYEWETYDMPGGGMKSQKSAVPTTFDPAGPPLALTPDSKGNFPTWEQVNEQYLPIAALQAMLMQRSPSALFLGAEGDADKVAKGDLATSRKEIGKGLQAMIQRIEKAAPLVGDDLEYLDFPPIQQALFAGAKSISGIKWNDPVKQAVAKRHVRNAEIGHLLASLGVGALSAAAFILAEFVTAGLATFLLVGAGMAIGAGQAAVSWDKYRDLSIAQEATVRPEMAVVSKEQVDSALLTAILDTAFVFLDGFGAVGALGKGGRAAKYGRELLEAGEAGAKQAAEVGLKGVGKDAAGAVAVKKAVEEVGPHEASRLSGKSFAELSEIVGKETDAGKRLASLAEAGTEGAAKAAADAAVDLPQLALLVAGGKLTQEQATKVVTEAIAHFGYIGTIQKAGGWKKLMSSGIASGPAGQAMETWRKGLLGELQQFLAKESDEATKAVRTGTSGAASDLDIQTVGGAAAMNADKANQWLAGRLGVAKDDLKGVLDMTIFVDPTRVHLQDVVKGLDPVDRAAIASRQASLEKQYIYAARLEAAKGNPEAIARITAEASERGVTPWKGFVPLTVEEQGKLARQADGWATELASATDAGVKSDLVSKIGDAQARINASNAEAYLGGGVRIWVTERDAAALAAAGIGLETKLGLEQRIISALSEGKFFDEAISTLRKPAATADDIAGALKDIGKHGERVTNVLRVEGKTSVEQLTELGARLKSLEKQAKSGELIKRMGSAADIKKEFDAANRMLAELKTQSSAALK